MDGVTYNEFLATETMDFYYTSLIITIVASLFFHAFYFYQELQKNKIKEQKVIAGTASAKFDALKQALNLSYNSFIRTTDSNHIAAAQEFWQKCNAKGDIYKKNYQVKYCVGCELEKTDSELENGKWTWLKLKITDIQYNVKEMPVANNVSYEKP